MGKTQDTDSQEAESPEANSQGADSQSLSSDPSGGGVIWDLPLRLFHWLLVAAVIASVASIKNGNMFIHEKAGLTVLGLLAFRILWGVVGSPHARFARFITAPARVMAYIKARREGDRTYHPGHAPTGGYATIAIILALLVMGGLGVMANDDVLYEAPLAGWAGDFSDTASLWHNRLERLMIAIITLHLLAIAFYRYVLKLRLIPPMIHGGYDPAVAATGRVHQAAGVVLLIGLVGLAHYLGYDGNRFY